MGVVSITRGWSGESAGDSTDGRKYFQDGVHYYTAVVTADTTWEDIKVHEDCPQLASGDPAGSAKICKERHGDKLGPCLWRLAIKYDSPTNPDNDNPLNEPARISFDCGTTEEPCDYDFNGDPIATANSEPYEPAPTRKFKLTKMVIKKNLASFDLDTAETYENTTNSAPFLNRPVGTCYMERITASPVDTEDFTYYEVVCEVLVRYDPESNSKAWWKRLAHQGFRVRFDTDDQGNFGFFNAVDENGEPSAVAVPLDQEGYALEADEPMVWKRYQDYGTSNFNSLGLF